MTQNPGVRATTPTSLAALRAGADVGGYRLVRRLGAGGMGVVWEVADASGHHVAMKILHPQIAADPMARRRLDREASVLARVKDSRVARILDIETGDGADGTGVTFVITELIDGPTLQFEVDHEGAYDLSTDIRDLADLAHGLADALSAVHDAGVIHRDLKPSNVMLGAQGPVLIDFGIAQVADDVRLTQTGQVTGTPGFIPPEMLDGDEPSPAVDWYACAGVLLFAVTGRAPFGSGPWQAVFRRVYAGTPELGDLEEECPALARAFTRALAPAQGERLAMADLLNVLDEVAEGGSGEAALSEALGEEDEAQKDTGTFHMGYGITSEPPSAPPNPAPPGAYGYIATAATSRSADASGPSGASAPSAGSSPPPVTGPSSPVPPRPGATASTGPTPGAAASGQIPPSIAPGSVSPARPAPSTGAAPGAGPGAGRGAPAAFPPQSAAAHPAAQQSAPQRPVAQQPQMAQRPAAPSPVHQPPAGLQWPATGPVAQPQVPQRPPAQQPASVQPASVHPPAVQPQAAQQGGAPTLDTGSGTALAGRGALPEWATEPARSTAIIGAIGLLLVAVSTVFPTWMVILATVLVVVVGTVGRAEDARRWRRLQAGRVQPSDNSRMWAAMPWYLLRSLVGSAFAVLPAVVAVSAMIYFWADGVFSGTGFLGTAMSSIDVYHRAGLFCALLVLVFLLIVWLVPWGATTRRGAARTVLAVFGPGQGRTIGLVGILAATAALLLLFVMSVLPPATLHPLFA
ncbi:MAG: protein kinase [Actinomyces sp.]|uniref:serine/threonine-protein kinase n=1 Tax=Actinomyces sp. TaxID=29317 RepID=UPI0026DC4F99|nr:serine/threonine protein kinase [Actinomyces sp.]MDO4243984.1 protein kinase [Actinomyces sp.]